MRVFKYLFFALLFLLIGFYIYGLFFLKDEVKVSRDIIIDRPAKVVYKAINSMHNFNQWSPWPKMDPDAKFTYQGPDKGVGSQMTWSGNQAIGSGIQTIVETIENKRIKTKTVFKSENDAVSFTTYELTAIEDDKTKVEWIYETDFEGDIIGRYVGSMLDDMLGPQYQQGLERLKQLVESQPVYDFTAISTESVDSQNILLIPIEAANQTEISTQLDNAYSRIKQFMTRNQLTPVTPPLAIYRQVGGGMSGENGPWKIDAAIGVNVSGLSGVTGEIQLGQIKAGQVVKFVHVGPYNQVERAYEIIDAYLEDRELMASGAPWEVYVNNSAGRAEKDWVTHIFQPVNKKP